MFKKTLAADIGSTYTRFVSESGVTEEKTLVSVGLGEKARVRAAGNAAGSAGGIKAEPVCRSLIADTGLASAFLSLLAPALAGRKRTGFIDLVIALPQTMGVRNKNAYLKAAARAGFDRCDIADASAMCALGAGEDIFSDKAFLILDIGRETMRCSALANGGVIFESADETGGERINAALKAFFREEYGILIGSGVAESIKLNGAGRRLSVCGRAACDGLPRSVTLEYSALEPCIDSALDEAVRFAADTVRALGADAAEDVMEKGMLLVGGGALEPRLKARMERGIGVPVRVFDKPRLACALGLQKLLFSGDARLIPRLIATGAYIDTENELKKRA